MIPKTKFASGWQLPRGCEERACRFLSAGHGFWRLDWIRRPYRLQKLLGGEPCAHRAAAVG